MTSAVVISKVRGMNISTWLDKERGRTKRMADHFGLSEGAITQWRANGVPVARMLEVLRITGGEVTLADMLEHRSSSKSEVA